MKPSDALKTHRDAVIEIISRIGATNISMFGHVVRGDDAESSDLDLLVDAPRGTTLFALGVALDDLQQTLGVRVDLLATGDIPQRMHDGAIAASR